jgi:hypothetical protein
VVFKCGGVRVWCGERCVRLPEVRSLEAVTDDSRVGKQVNPDPAPSRINSEITNVQTVCGERRNSRGSAGRKSNTR